VEERSLESADSIARADITMLLIQARGMAGMLFRRIARNDGDIITVYNRFVELFYQLYLAFKYNAAASNVENWEEKQKIYDSFFNKIFEGKVDLNILKYFDALVSDMVSAGIYNFSKGNYVEISDLNGVV